MKIKNKYFLIYKDKEIIETIKSHNDQTVIYPGVLSVIGFKKKKEMEDFISSHNLKYSEGLKIPDSAGSEK